METVNGTEIDVQSAVLHGDSVLVSGDAGTWSVSLFDDMPPAPASDIPTSPSYPSSLHDAVVNAFRSTNPNSLIASYSLSPPTATECTRCPPVPAGHYTAPDNCAQIGCNDGYWLNASSCVPCSTSIQCPSGQFVTQCSSASNARCAPCTTAPCRKGMFREQCHNGRDAKCVSCVPPGWVGTYRWTGGGCDGFVCAAGLEKVGKKCV